MLPYSDTPVSPVIQSTSLLPLTPKSPSSTIPLTPSPAYAQAPTKLIKKAPRNTSKQAYTLRLPLSTFQLSSLRKSSDMSSTSEAKTRNPAEIAFMIPTTRRPTSESGEYKVCVAMPIAMPPGVLGVVLAGRINVDGGRTYVQPYARAMSHGCAARGFHLMSAIRTPRARPSKVSIKVSIQALSG